MRIITGKARGARLISLPGDETRPTAEKVKEGVFSAIQFDIGGRTVLDLFGGSGQRAREALSRGADSAVIVDSSRQAADIIRRNAANTGLIPDCRIVCADWKEYIKSASGKQKFSLIFLDPPYKAGFIDEVLKRLLAAGLADDGAIIVSESAIDGVPEPIPGYTGKVYRYGKTCVTVMRAQQ